MPSSRPTCSNVRPAVRICTAWARRRAASICRSARLGIKPPCSSLDGRLARSALEVAAEPVGRGGSSAERRGVTATTLGGGVQLAFGGGRLDDFVVAGGVLRPQPGAGGPVASAGSDVAGEVGLDGERGDAKLVGDLGDGEALGAERAGLLAALLGVGGGQGSLPEVDPGCPPPGIVPRRSSGPAC